MRLHQHYCICPAGRENVVPVRYKDWNCSLGGLDFKRIGAVPWGLGQGVEGSFLQWVCGGCGGILLAMKILQIFSHEEASLHKLTLARNFREVSELSGARRQPQSGLPGPLHRPEDLA